MAYTDEPYTRVATAESKIMVTASFEKKKKKKAKVITGHRTLFDRIINHECL